MTVARALPARRAAVPRLPRVRLRWLALALPVLLLGGYLATNVSASLAQRSLRAEWADTLSRARGLSVAELAQIRPEAGDAVARLAIPAMGLDAIVIEGAAPAQTRRAPAHLPGTPLPGEDGTAVITGNRLGWGGFFSSIDRLRIGDPIRVQTVAGSYAFVVRGIDTVATDRLDPRPPGAAPGLMLFAGAKRWGGGSRIVIRAERAP